MPHEEITEPVVFPFFDSVWVYFFVDDCCCSRCFFIGLYSLSNVERDEDYYQTQLEELAIEIGDPYEYKEFGNEISDALPEKTWLQIIDEEGKVVESANVPEDIKENYSSFDIVQMKEREQLGEYAIKYTLEEPLFASDDAYLFVLGYQEPGKILINELSENTNANGRISETDQPRGGREIKPA